MGEGFRAHHQYRMFCSENVHLVKEIRAQTVSGDFVHFGEFRDSVSAGENDAGTSVRKLPQDFSNLFWTGKKSPLVLSNLPRTFKA